MKRFPGILLMIMIACNSLSAQTSVSFAIQKSSFLTIQGSSNLLVFNFKLNGEHIPGNIFTVTTTQDQNRIYISQNTLSIDVKKFSSGNKMALRDFLKLIKSDTYPYLQVQLNSVELQPNTNRTQFSDINVSVDVLGSVTIAGVNKQYKFPITYCRYDNTYAVDGTIKLSIRDFGLTPPVTMMGLIKVSEWIDIGFHIICLKY